MELMGVKGILQPLPSYKQLIQILPNNKQCKGLEHQSEYTVPVVVPTLLTNQLQETILGKKICT